MNRALYASACGMAVEQAKLDLITGNLANADAVGFKSSAMDFAALVDGGQTVGATSLGTHVRLTQGKLMQSAGPFDMAIDGDGFFALRDAAGAPVYSRDGRFVRGGDGVLRNADGAALPGIKLGPDATNVSIDGAGNVFADTGDGKHRPMGKVTLAIFAAPQGLRSNGGTSFAATRASGAAKIVAPQSHGAGRIAFGMLEKSNVSIMEEMMEILSAQRAFEANSKGVEAADEIQRIANNINRGQ